MPAKTRHARVAGLAVLLACTGGPPTDPASTGPIPAPHARTALPPLFPGALALVGVNVVSLDGAGAVQRDQTVLVRDGRIAAVGPRAATPVPDDATVVPGAAGAFVMPGLVDAHVHLLRKDVGAYLRAGITTVRNMWGTPGVAAMRAEVAAGGAELPTIFSAGPGIDGPPAVWPYTELPATADDAAALVTRQAAEGWDFIKVYDRLDAAAYAAVVRRARELNVAVIGHVPRPVGLDGALGAGQASIEHMTGYAQAVGGWGSARRETFAGLARRTAARGIWNCPTLLVGATLHGGISDDSPFVVDRRLMVRTLYDAGAPILAGTDAGIDIVPPGSSLALEIEELGAAGLPAVAALRAATSEPARFLGADGEIGAVRVGMRADLVLLPSDPLADLRALRAPLGTVLRGRWLPARP